MRKSASAPLAGSRVFVVDSDQSVAKSVTELLSGLNVAVTVFDTAAALLTQNLHDSRIACLLIEAKLPDMNGVELLERLNSDGIQVPTIILAACGDVSTAVRAMRANAVDFIEKPFVESLLLKRIRLILEAHKVQYT